MNPKKKRSRKSKTTAAVEVTTPVSRVMPRSKTTALYVVGLGASADGLEALSTFSLLARRGYQVQTAADASSALALSATHEFDLMISDIGLPDRNGLELMKEIHAQRPLRSVAMSGFGMDTDVAKSKAAGFSEHLTKPVDFEDLDAILQRLAAATR